MTEDREHNGKGLKTEGHKDKNTTAEDRKHNDRGLKTEGHKDKNRMTEE